MDYDLFVIGAGSGGIRAARTAAELGARVAVADHGRLGGTCVNVGCVPKKLFVYASHFAESFRDAAGYGWQVSDTRLSWPALRANKDREIERLNGIYQELLDKAGIDLYRGPVRIDGPHGVHVEPDRSVSAAHILIATGSRPTRPDIPGFEFGITSDDAFFQEQLPQRAMIVGGGYIGVEFAGIYHGLGVETLLIHRGELFLRGFDQDCRRFLADQMRGKGVDLRFNCEPIRIDRAKQQLQVTLSDGREESVDQIFFATGRRPNTERLGLEQTGVELTDRRAVRVDRGYTTTIPSIHAVGDVIDRVMLTPMAIAEGALLARRLFGKGGTAIDYDLIPTCIFSQPNLASIGLSEIEARKQGLDAVVYRTEFRPLQHSLTANPERCLIKLVVDRASDRVLGAFMVGPDAGEILQGLAVALKAGARKTDFDHTLGIHPTVAEEFVTLRKAVEPPLRPVP